MIRLLMRSLIFFVLLSSFWNAASAATSAPQGMNCSLSVPPPDAGEVSAHGTILRVYPRAKDITLSYSGCQALFAPDGTKWTVVSLTEVIDGDPVRVWSAEERGSALLTCRFKRGKVVQGNQNECPAPEFLLIKSMSAGCTRLVQQALAKQGLQASLPPECEHQ